MDRKDCDNRPMWAAAGPARRLGDAGVALALLCAPLMAETVHLWPEATVEGKVVHLGDIAQLQGFQDADLQRVRRVQLAPAAAPGQHSEITLRDVRHKLRDANVNLATTWIKGAAVCVVKTAAVMARSENTATAVMDDGTLRSAIRAALQRELGDPQARLELSFDPAGRGLLDLAEPTYAFDIRRIGQQLLGDLQFDVRIRRGSEPAQRHRLRVNATMRRSVVVVMQPLERGQTLERSDVALVERSFTAQGAMGLTRLEAAVGLEARRALLKGEMLRPGDLRAVELVRRQDLIAVQVRSSGLVLECSARALQRGFLGDVIEVRNEASEQNYHARVTGLRQAEAVVGGVAASEADPHEGATHQ